MSISTAERDAIEVRREQVASMRLRGWSERKIGAMLGVSGVTIHNDLVALKRRWREAQGAAIEEHQARLMAELHEVKQACWERDDTDGVLRALAQETKLLGTDAPTKNDHTIDLTSYTPEQREARIQSLLAIARGNTNGSE